MYTMALPLMLSLLIQSLYNIVDSIYVSRLSEKALTATSLTYPIQFLMIAVGVGTAVGLNALLSRRIGQRRNEDACRAATTGMIIMTGTAVLFSIIGLLASRSIAEMMTKEEDLRDLCTQYMKICTVWCYGIFLQTYGQRLLQAVGDTVFSMISLVIGAVVNIILDPIMIFGLLGCPQMGIVGAAAATVIGQSIGALAALLFNRFRNPVIHVSFRNYRFSIADVADIYRVGMPTIVMQAIGSVMTFLVNSILLTVSPTAVAFFGVFYKLQNFLMMPMNGLGQAAIPIVGFNYGAKNRTRIHEAWRVMIPTAIGFAVFGTVVFLLFPGQLLGLFAASDEMLAIGVPALRIISVSFVCSAMTIICGYFASGLGNGVINMVGGAIRQLIVLVPLLALSLRIVGLPWAWGVFWIAEGAAFAYSYMSVRKEIRNKVDMLP